MPFTSGVSGNPGGRPRGSANRINQQLRETITDFLEENFQKVINDFEELNPKERVKLYCDLLQYGLPKLQAVQIESEIERLPEDQLDYIIKKITNGAD